MSADSQNEMFDIEMTPVEGSSNIEEYGYHAPSQTLRVRYKGKKLVYYDYAAVDGDKHAALCSADSKGSYIAQEIVRGGHTFNRFEKKEEKV